jgi:2,4-dienoyl-CoA reductase (NADPH2)
MLNSVEYLKIDDDGLHITRDGAPSVLAVDTIIICAGQLPFRSLYDNLLALGQDVSLVGGAYEAAELDAKAAISQASYMAAQI